MNRRLLFNEIARMAQSDRDYYIFGNPSQIGLIEDFLAYFGRDYKIEAHSRSMHLANLKLLESFILNTASEEQLIFIREHLGAENPLPKPDLALPNHGKVFVSMPMNKEKCEYIDVIRDGIRRGIESGGNEAYFLDFDAHNENIVSKMLSEIVGCKFLVADFTSQNAGVYYEAGYASALGKTVIHTCNRSDFDSVHFDIKQTQFILWDNADDLAARLSEQIRNSGLSES